MVGPIDWDMRFLLAETVNWGLVSPWDVKIRRIITRHGYYAVGEFSLPHGVPTNVMVCLRCLTVGATPDDHPCNAATFVLEQLLQNYFPLVSSAYYSDAAIAALAISTMHGPATYNVTLKSFVILDDPYVLTDAIWVDAQTFETLIQLQKFRCIAQARYAALGRIPGWINRWRSPVIQAILPTLEQSIWPIEERTTFMFTILTNLWDIHGIPAKQQTQLDASAILGAV